jgi:hypothetical protein
VPVFATRPHLNTSGASLGKTTAWVRSVSDHSPGVGYRPPAFVPGTEYTEIFISGVHIYPITRDRIWGPEESPELGLMHTEERVHRMLPWVTRTENLNTLGGQACCCCAVQHVALTQRRKNGKRQPRRSRWVETSVPCGATLSASHWLAFSNSRQRTSKRAIQWYASGSEVRRRNLFCSQHDAKPRNIQKAKPSQVAAAMEMGFWRTFISGWREPWGLAAASLPRRTLPRTGSNWTCCAGERGIELQRRCGYAYADREKNT